MRFLSFKDGADGKSHTKNKWYIVGGFGVQQQLKVLV